MGAAIAVTALRDRSFEFSGLQLKFDWSHSFFNWGGSAYSAGAVSLAVILLDIFVFQMLLMGACRFYVENRDYNAPVSKLLFGFKSGYYGNSVLVMFMKNLVCGSVAPLLVIPGIVMSYGLPNGSYSSGGTAGYWITGRLFASARR